MLNEKEIILFHKVDSENIRKKIQILLDEYSNKTAEEINTKINQQRQSLIFITKSLAVRLPDSTINTQGIIIHESIIEISTLEKIKQSVILFEKQAALQKILAIRQNIAHDIAAA